MRTHRFLTWNKFRGFCAEYSDQPFKRRERLIFRGHASAAWPLMTTLDRHKTFASDAARAAYALSLHQLFFREASTVGFPPQVAFNDPAFEMLARHHGIPSMLLDWTKSPYVAAYFALEAAVTATGRLAALWMLDLDQFTVGAEIDMIDEPELLRFNLRAQRQRGLFTRTNTILRPMTAILDNALTKLEIRSSMRQHALAELDEMGLNATTLFTDLDGAATTTLFRVLG